MRVRFGGRTFGFLFCLCAAMVVLAHPAHAQSTGYDMPAMPLSDALTTLAKRAGFHLNYDERLARGRTSAPVVGAKTPQEALDQALGGSGLTPRFTRRDAFTIVPQPAAERPDLKLDDLVVTAPLLGTPPSGVDYAWYGGLVLQECMRKLRTFAELKGRKYELKLYVWLASDGQVTRLQVRGTPDQAETLRLIEDRLSGMRLASLPPDSMPQPILLRIVAM